MNTAPTNRGFVAGFDMDTPQPFVFEPAGEAKRHAPATERNRDAITEILNDVLPASGLVLEIASGTGEHVVHFAQTFPRLKWQPSDPDPAALASITAWTADSTTGNILPPLLIDASTNWPVDHADALICINMVHISTWAATLGLLKNAARILPVGGILYLYGPYRRRDVMTAASNEEFDRSLKDRNPAWGLRFVEDFEAEALIVGMSLERLIEMPANNLSLIFRSTRLVI
jgi:SAM-dependent methyltransferase